MARRHAQVEETIVHLAADFFAREFDTGSLVTVTRAELSGTMQTVTVFFSVLPHAMEERMLASAKRAGSGFRAYLRDNSFLRPAPAVDFEIDYGEKNRQRVDELTRMKKEA